MAEDTYCNKHGAHCVLIERMEKDLIDRKNESRDTRRSLTHDMERRDASLLKMTEQVKDDNERLYVTKHEFEPIRKLVYGTALLMVAEVIRRVFL